MKHKKNKKKIWKNFEDSYSIWKNVYSGWLYSPTLEERTIETWSNTLENDKSDAYFVPQVVEEEPNKKVEEIRTQLDKEMFKVSAPAGLRRPLNLGYSKDVPIVEHKGGGKSANIPFRYDLCPPEALAVLAKVMYEGAVKYAPNNWRKCGRNVHINHAIAHLVAYMDGDTQDDHLDHALARVAMAVAVPKEEEGFSYK